MTRVNDVRGNQTHENGCIVGKGGGSLPLRSQNTQNKQNFAHISTDFDSNILSFFKF